MSALAEYYPLIKLVHVGSVAISGPFFLLRFFWRWRGSPLAFRRWVRIAPHGIDTVLLTSAVLLALATSQYPLQVTWLSAKVAALLLYIALGMLAMKGGPGPLPPWRAGAAMAAGGVYAYIVAVALSRSPLPGLAL